jgi:hypothetical protein
MVRLELAPRRPTETRETLGSLHTSMQATSRVPSNYPLWSLCRLGERSGRDEISAPVPRDQELPCVPGMAASTSGEPPR